MANIGQTHDHYFQGHLRKIITLVAKEVDKHEERLKTLELAQICQDIHSSQFCMYFTHSVTQVFTVFLLSF